MMFKQLNINNYKVHFILGNKECEKFEKRSVIINISIRFPNKSEQSGKIDACHSDNLSDSICYLSLITFIEERLKNVRFNLIEKAAQFVYDTILEYTKDKGRDILIRIEIIKPNYFDKNFESSSFVLSDW